MKTVDIRLASLSLQLDSDDPEKILCLVDQINHRISTLKAQHRGITDIKAVLILVLTLQDELNSSQVAHDRESTLIQENKELKESFYNLLEHLTEKINDLTCALRDD
jgi:cell division protein ZapA (FtsZ GTPase activity inhibitor)